MQKKKKLKKMLNSVVIFLKRKCVRNLTCSWKGSFFGDLCFELAALQAFGKIVKVCKAFKIVFK